MTGKPLAAILALALLCALATACQTTPPAAGPPPPARPAGPAQPKGPAAQPQASASANPQPAAQAQRPAAQSPQQKGAARATPPARRPDGTSAVASQLTKLGSRVSAGVGGLIGGARTLLGIKPKPARRSVPVQAPKAEHRGVPILPTDSVAVVVTAVVLLGGCGLSLAAIIAGRRRAKVAET